MLKLGGREFVALLLSLLIATPPKIASAANGSAARAALGSIDSRGAVRIGEVLTPSQNTIFAGDRVQTNNGGAVIQYRQGSRVVLSSETVADFAPTGVQLEKGLMTFEVASNSGMIFAASTLRLEPVSAKTSANVNFTDSKASVAVTEGTLKVVDPSGLQLASLNAGEARMFEESPASPEPASAASPAPAAPAAPPQGGGGGNGKWVLAIGAAVVGVTLGVVGIVRANDANSRADTANAAAASANSAASAAAAQVTALQAQVTAANTRATALQAQVTALAGDASISAALSADLATQLARLSQVQAQLSTIVAQLAAGQITSAQAQQQLTTLQGTLTTILAAVNRDQGLLVACSQPVLSVTNPNCHT